MNISTIKTAGLYFEFLCNIVWKEGRQIDVEKEIFLLRGLEAIEFYALIPNDDNRASDGLQLRDNYIDEGGAAQALPSGSCSVLEMLIGLSNRLVLETESSKWEKPVDKWFWILIDNLNLSRLLTFTPMSEQAISDNIEWTITNLLERNYKSNGEGGLFPLKHTNQDQRRIEIWYQMTAYIIENYQI